MRSAGQVAQRVVQHLDVARRGLQELADARVAVHRVPAHAEVRRVDLQQEARADDRLVLRAHRLAERLEVGILRRVVVVRLEQREHARRCGVHERLDRLRRVHRPAEVGEVRVERFRILQRDLADAARAPVLRGRAARRELRHEPRELHQILSRLARRVAAEAGEAVGDIGRVADLVGLAVADDVDAGLDLPADHGGDGVA